MSGDEARLFGKARRFFSCLAGFSDSTAEVQRFGAHGKGNASKAPGQPAGLPRPNGPAGNLQGGTSAATLRHNPIDVCLTMAEPVSVLQGNPSQRVFEATWSGVPVHLQILTFVKRPNPITQLPGRTSPHATVAAALDAPPPAQANMLAQPDMIAVATEVEAALVQLIAEPTQQVLPVLACAKVTCRAHIGSPGDEHVTQRIIAEVHIVTPRVPGLVSLSQWLQDRWPQCEIGTTGGGRDPNPAGTTATPAPNAPAGPAGGAAAPGSPPSAAPPLPTAPSNSLSQRFLTSTAQSPSAAQGGRLDTAAAAAVGIATATPDVRSPRQAAALASAGGASGPGRSGQEPGSGPVPSEAASRLGVSQPIAEGLAAGDYGRPNGGGGQNRGGQLQQQLAGGSSAAAAAARASICDTDVSDHSVVPGCVSCLGYCFAPPAGAAAVQTVALPTQLGCTSGGDPSGAGGPGKTASPGGGTPASPFATGAVTEAAPAAGSRRLAAPNAAAPTGRQRLPLPPPPPRRPQLPLPEALEVLICLAEALRNLHRRGLTHGSLTPKTIQLQLVEADEAALAAAAAAAAAAASTSRTTTDQPQESVYLQSLTPNPHQQPNPQPAHGCGPFEAPSTARDPSTAASPCVSPSIGGTVTGVLEGSSPLAPTATDVAAVPATSGSPVSAATDAAHASGAGSGGPASAWADARAPAGSDAPAAEGCEVGPPRSAFGYMAATAATDRTTLKPPPTTTMTTTTTAPSNAVRTQDGLTQAEAEAATSTGEVREAGLPAATSPRARSAVTVAADAAAVGSAHDSRTAVRPPVVTVAPSSPRRRSLKPVRRRQPGIRAMLPLPAVGPAMLQLQTWGRAKPVNLPREHLLWCAPELLNGGIASWGPPLLARRSGNGSGSMGLGPLDQSLGCRGAGNRVRGGGHHHSHRFFGDGSYGASMGGTSRRYRCPTSLLTNQPPQDAACSGAPGAHGIAPSCDVYSLGMLMWYLVSGQPPFQHLASQDQVLRVKEIGSLDEQLPFSSELPMGYIHLARRCWALLPMQRPSMNMVLSEMRSLRAQLLGLGHQLAGEHGFGFGYGGSSMGEMTSGSRPSVTLSLPLSSRDLSNGEEYPLVRPPLELAFGANDASRGGVGGAAATVAGEAGANGLTVSVGPPPPPPLKTALPAALLTALTAPRRASGCGGGSGLMDDDDYSDADRFTEHIDTNEHTDASGTPYSSPTTGTGGGGRGGGGTSARLRSMTATAAAAAATARSFRMFRVGSMGRRQGSTAGSIGRSGGGGGGGAGPAALLAANGSRRGTGLSPVRGALCSFSKFERESPGSPVGGRQQRSANAVAVHTSIGKGPGTAAAASFGHRCASSGALYGLGAAPPPPVPSVVAPLRFSLTQARGSCAAAAAANSSSGAGGGGSSSKVLAIIPATSASVGCLAVPCGNGSGSGSD